MKNISVFLFFLTVLSCSQKQETEGESDFSSKQKLQIQERNSGLRNSLLGKKSSFLDSLSGSEDLVILYFTVSDCNFCLEQMVSLIDSVKRTDTRVKITPLLKGPRFEHFITTRYPEAVHDSTYQLENQFGFISTPSIILYSSEHGLIDAYIIPKFENPEGESRILNVLTTRNGR